MMYDSGTRIGMYVIDELLSEEGGMSRIYLAHEQDRPDYPVTLKVGLNEGEKAKAYKDMLHRESSMLAKLHHPSIVHIVPQRFGRGKTFYTAKTENDEPYYVMEYIAGPMLDAYAGHIAEYFPIEWALELFYQIVLAVHYMHQLGYAHCDLKPQNILLRRMPDPNYIPQPVLIDFGAVSPVNLMTELAVSVQYAPPEALMALDRPDMSEYRNIRADKVDIWGLGVILYQIVTGKPLFNERKEHAIKTTILRGQIEKITETRIDAHESLDKLMIQMLKREPGERPTTTQIIDALERRIASVRPPRFAVKL